MTIYISKVMRKQKNMKDKETAIDIGKINDTYKFIDYILRADVV